MDKTIRSDQMARLCALLRTTREDAGLRQEDVAKRVGEPQSFVSKYESGERRLDLVELEQVCRALDTDLVSFVTRYADDGRAGGR